MLKFILINIILTEIGSEFSYECNNICTFVFKIKKYIYAMLSEDQKNDGPTTAICIWETFYFLFLSISVFNFYLFKH